MKKRALVILIILTLIISQISPLGTNGQVALAEVNMEQINKTVNSTTWGFPQLSKWVISPTNQYIYALSSDGESLLYINTVTLETDKSLALSAPATDVIQSDGKIYLAIDSANQILVIDISSNTIEKTIQTTTDPYHFVKDGTVLYYINYQWSDLYGCNLTTGNEVKLNTRLIYKPEIAVNTTDHLIYLGESGSSGCNLYYYSIIDNKIIGKSSYNNGDGFVNAARSLVYDGKHVFYAGRTFNPTNAAQMEGDYDGNNPIIASANGLVFTADSVYVEETHVKLGNLKTPASMIILSSDDSSIYLYANGKITSYTFSKGSIDADSIIDLIGGTYATPIPSTTTSTRTTEIERSLPMSSELTKWVYDDNSRMLYAISEKDKAVFYIDKKTLNIVKTIRLVSQPTDIICENNSLFVVLNEVRQIIEIDILSGDIVNKYNTISDPYHIIKDGNYLYYADYGQLCDVYRYDITTRAEKELNIEFFYYPTLAVNRDKHILYIGRSAFNGGSLYYYDMVKDEVIGYVSSTNYNGGTTLYDGTYVFYNGAAYDPNTPKLVKSLGSGEIVFAKQGAIFTNTKVYSEEDFSLIETLPESYNLFEMSGNFDLFTYSIDNQEITKRFGNNPEISGVEDGACYIKPVTITFDYGTALLDGKPINSGYTVTEVGSHELIVTGDEDNKTEVGFTIYEALPDDDTPVVFADDNFKKALIDKDVDSNTDGVITHGEMRVLTSLNLESNNITDLTGLEYAVNLESLYLNENNVSDITNLSGLIKLESLDLAMNKLVNISSLQNLVNLSVLYLDNNNINDISSLSHLTNLTTLGLSYNQVVDITPLANLINLSDLDLTMNNIVDIGSLSKLKMLGSDNGKLQLGHNQITDITAISDLTNLGYLNISYNKISRLSDLNKLVNLKVLFIANCGLNSLSGVENLINLASLDVSLNNITNISELSKLKDLGLLDLSGNHLQSLSPLQGLNLIGLLVSGCGISEISELSNMTNLILLDLSNNDINNIYILNNMTKLISLDVSNNVITDIAPIRNLNILGLDVSQNYLDISSNSTTKQIINKFANTSGSSVIYTPQKDINQVPVPVITISNFIKTPTNQDINVTATTDKGTLNATSHTFTQNGSFTFVATDRIGRKASITVTITNIDKTPPVIIANPNTIAPTNVVIPSAVKTCMVIFNSQGGSTVESKTVPEGTYIPAPANPQRTGYRFDGWYSASEGGMKISFPYNAGANANLYAHWTSSLMTPTSLKVTKPNAKSAKITWKSVKGATLYEVYNATSSAGKYKLIAAQKSTKFQKSGLIKGKTYYFKVRAYKTIKGKKVYSKYTSVAKVKI